MTNTLAKLFLVSTTSWVAVSAQTVTGTVVSLSVQPDAPVQLSLLEPADLERPISLLTNGVPVPIQDTLFNQHIEVRNVSQVGALGAYVRRHHVGAQTGGGCGGTVTNDRSNPWLKPGESTTIRNTLKRNHQDIEVAIDLVLLADGTYWGPDACGFMGKIQERMHSETGLYGVLLNLLERRGIEAVEAKIRKEAVESGERMKFFSNLRRVRP